MTTLREQAAIAAMQGLLANANESMHAVAANARICADALLADLERTAPKPAAGATRLTCTAAERELIEASLAPSLSRCLDALDAIRAERRSALPGAGGES